MQEPERVLFIGKIVCSNVEKVLYFADIGI